MQYHLRLMTNMLEMTWRVRETMKRLGRLEGMVFGSEL